MKNIDLINLYKPSNDLYDKVINKIIKEQNISTIKKKLFLFSLFFVLSFSFLIFSIVLFFKVAYSSGFLQIFSLIFSDFNIVSNYFINFSISLLESIPILNMIMFLFMTIIFSFIFKMLIKNIKNFTYYNCINN